MNLLLMLVCAVMMTIAGNVATKVSNEAVNAASRSTAKSASLEANAAAPKTGTPGEEAKTDAQKSFEQLKGLAGTWEGKVKTDPPMPEMDGAEIKVTLRVTSRGNALMHEMTGKGPDDPITMMYVDGDRLLLTHYCDAGNRPRMSGKALDGKTVDFTFVDVSGSDHEHMHHAKFTAVDADHHSEDWTFMAGETAIKAHMELQRVK